MSLNRRISDRIEDPAEKRRYVRALFAGVAGKYDLTNDVMSFGLHRRWKTRVLELARIEAGHRVLDLAAGTGDLALAAGEIGDGSASVDVVATDLTPEMLRVGAGRAGDARLAWVAGDAASLPYPDESFDRVVIGYGLRNFANLDDCLAEILRSLRPGGRLVTLDFGHPRSELIRRGYFGYLDASTRLVGWALHRDAESYVYIPESLRRFPGQRDVVRRMEAVGYEGCGYEDLLLGTMAINFGRRPRP
ncbi:MAG: ubiquinone/menaquinone biosynthesis methyltransferase [Gemmatimonadetes bacterium]|nr:ubiquinone/menaquinone biosynthesis methyltransferase [Gemmatimonadota bacterium]